MFFRCLGDIHRFGGGGIRGRASYGQANIKKLAQGNWRMRVIFFSE